jgi:Protein of unknown function (DUF3606)
LKNLSSAAFGSSWKEQCENKPPAHHMFPVRRNLRSQLCLAVAEQIARGDHYHSPQESPMRRAKPLPARNKIDLADPTQIRVWTRRLGITTDDLQRVVRKVGNSIASVSKEIQLRKAAPRTPPLSVQIDPVPLPAIEAVAADAQLATAGGN